MSNGPELSGEQWGWVVAVAASTWAVVLRFVIGHYIKIGEKLDKRLEKIEERLTNIELRSRNRRKGD